MSLGQLKSGIVLAGISLLALSVPAYAKSPSQSGDATKRYFEIPAGPLDAALKTWSRLTKRSVLFQSAEIADKRTSGAKGAMTPDEALDAILARTGFGRINEAAGAVAIVAQQVEADGGNATPDILVTGKAAWSLNTGIARTQDDSQPFIVLTREEIQRSGAPNLETFLRDRLNVNTSPVVSQQARGGTSGTAATRGLSAINLRGLGTRDTLILVDGRRQPGVNIGDGNLTQPSITGIPLASIERIEVLASSASGIYGSGASGGAINIVLKRDFTGGEISTSYSDTTDFAQGETQTDITYGFPLEGGRTKVSLTGSWQKARPLYYGDRANLATRTIAKIRENDASYFEGAYVSIPSGGQVNYKTFLDTLTLKPEYGGGTMPSTYGTVPAGYRGLLADGVAPLAAANGRYNYDLNGGYSNLGRRSPLLYGSERYNASVSVRREFNDRLTGYLGVTWARTLSSNRVSRGPEFIELSSEAPQNPFQQSIQLILPGVALGSEVHNRQTSSTLVGGVIAKLPWDWQAALDVSYARSRFVGDVQPSQISQATEDQLVSGTQNVLRDLTLQPLSLSYDDLPFFTAATPGTSSTFAPSLRIAGPLPLRLPGGKTQMTLNVEYSDQRNGGVITASNRMTRSILSYAAPASQRTWSAYGEIALPIISDAHKIALFRQLELRLSARAEWYRGNGADPYNCAITFGPLPADNPLGNCPPAGAVVSRSITRNSHIDPSISFRWTPFKPLVIRGSYTTGYLPPTLTQLVKVRPEFIRINFADRARGGEKIGSPGTFGNQIPGFIGGNPDVRPESSRTFSAGAIFTPGLVPGLRVSADWTRIKKRDVYFNPLQLLAFSANSQQAIEDLLASNPNRVKRGPASGGFSVGPITELDLSLVNLLGISTDAIDFVVDYDAPLSGGNLTVTSRATFVKSLEVMTFPGVPATDYAGVVPTNFAIATGSNGSLRWRGSAAINWSKDALNLGWQIRYIDRYAIDETKTVVPALGSAYVRSQIYHDVSASYQLLDGLTARIGVNNIFNKRPPLDVTADPLFYSAYGDPRLRSFYLRLQKTF
ncbi:outer membrane receptor protein involved in Fe transport [Sphingomonas insulae]|uniref:TonB-dependent receptor n=1 Tax=Sphingomonas insulae TaxID=424800 RepID=A0ABN1HYM0_9SPHN|nr:TonB-dependent receptor [Sphingomonas insulae]NIJ29640.1 outer membrane receptor protein involved in Fe transport [Sphingomonas insulae]